MLSRNCVYTHVRLAPKLPGFELFTHLSQLLPQKTQPKLSPGNPLSGQQLDNSLITKKFFRRILKQAL